MSAKVDGLNLPQARAVDNLLIIIMGVSGCGKSTLGSHIASVLALPYIDGDDLHPQSNVDKMSRGEPLTDDDRAPWLLRVRDVAAEEATKMHQSLDKEEATAGNRTSPPSAQDTQYRSSSVVVACSALKRNYRDVLRGGQLRVVFVHPHGDYDILLSRMSARKDHYMKANMLNSQLATLEDPEGEPDVVRVPIEEGMVEQVKTALEGIQRLGALAPA